jgi:hypothetical protein
MGHRESMDALLATLRQTIPGFCERTLTYEDFLAACKREGIAVEVRPYLFDEYLSRRGRRPRITINAGLAPLYKTFVAFHALGHWFAHPGDQEFYLGSPDWLHRVELEASTVGFLALSPWPNGPPYPHLERARILRGRRDAVLGPVPARASIRRDAQR